MRRILEANGRNAAHAADGLFVVGSILAVSGAIVLFLPQSRRAKKKKKKAAFIPQVAPRISEREIGVGLVGRF
jgi:hypothetical protein